MTKLTTNVKTIRLIKVLEKLGFVEKKARGSHRRLVHPDGRWTQVAVHPRPIPPGTLRKILNQVGLNAKELKDSL